MKECLFGVSKKRFYLYFIVFIFSILLSVVMIILNFYTSNPVINYFIGFSASLVITDVFAYVLDCIGNSELQQIKKQKRQIYMEPVKNYMCNLLFSTFMLRDNYYPDLEKEYSLDDFANSLIDVFRKYKEYISVLVRERQIEAINCACNIKNGIEIYCVNQLLYNINVILGNKHFLKTEGLFNENELISLKILYDNLEKLKFPYLNTSEKDDNKAIARMEWPDENIKSIVENNFISNAKGLQSHILMLIKIFPEMESLTKISYHHPNF